MTSSMPLEVDVVVVGAGPTGLAASIALRTAGLDPVTIDLAGGVSGESRAAGVQPRTLEMLDLVGVGAHLATKGLAGAAFVATTPERVLLQVDFTALDSPYPEVLLVPQTTTEEVLEAALVDAGGSVRRGHRLIALRQEFDAVQLQVADPEGVVHSLRARWVVAADGVHSGVRSAAGIGFEGERDDERYLLADVRVDPSSAPPQVTFCFSAEGLLLLSPLPGDVLRVVAGFAAGAPVPPDASVDGVQALIDRRAPRTAGSRVREVLQSGPYSVTTRLASRFRAGRILLAGDAAHVHSPAGGQGMNTGIQDALGLAWRLAAVLLHGAPDALLDAYDAERRPNAAALLGFTRQITRVATTPDPRQRALRDQLLTAAGSMPDVTGFLAGRLGQLDVRTVPGTEDEPVGRRVRPTADDRYAWSLLVPEGTDVHAGRIGIDVHERAGLAGALLVRPDGYCADRTDRLDPDALHALVGRRYLTALDTTAAR